MCKESGVLNLERRPGQGGLAAYAVRDIEGGARWKQSHVWKRAMHSLHIRLPRGRR